jgi:hypothetical protein
MANLLKIDYLSTKICIVYSRLNMIGRHMAVCIKKRSPKTHAQCSGRPLTQYSIMLSGYSFTLLLFRTTSFFCCLFLCCLFLCSHYFHPLPFIGGVPLRHCSEQHSPRTSLLQAINIWHLIAYTLPYIEVSREFFEALKQSDVWGGESIYITQGAQAFFDEFFTF